MGYGHAEANKYFSSNILVGFMVLNLVFHVGYYMRKNRAVLIIERKSQESKISRIVGNILVGIYLVTTYLICYFYTIPVLTTLPR